MRPLAAPLLGVAIAALAAPAAGAQAPAPGFVEFTNVPALSVFPDSRNTRIFVSAYSATSATETVIVGRAPRARYFSLAILDLAQREVDALNDGQIELDADGTFTVVVRARCGGEPNCLSPREGGAPAVAARIYYRLYVPEGDDCGEAGLPSIAYRPAGSRFTPPPRDDCPPRLPGLPAARGGLYGPVVAGATGAPPRVYRFDAGSESGTGGTEDNAYAYFSYDLARGNVLVTTRVPTYQRQHSDDASPLARADGSEQVRYWSFCTTQTSRPVACLRDEEVITEGEQATVLVSPSCPVAGYPNCLEGGLLALGPGGSGSEPDLGAAATTTFIFRNLLARPDFATPAGPERCPPVDAQYCGSYAPQVRYVPRPTPAP